MPRGDAAAIALKGISSILGAAERTHLDVAGTGVEVAVDTTRGATWRARRTCCSARSDRDGHVVVNLFQQGMPMSKCGVGHRLVLRFGFGT